ncbi:hypothetical protein ACQP1G_34220 [Nocardia sp. CA-107356]|uniref:hypothetical protein n=1 Tax=Nocardia sp. CA-107356 TaxID=3239972 RepID=UPI003D8A76B0
MNHNDKNPVPSNAEIDAAARELRATIAIKSAELADRLLARPAYGTPEWERDWDQRNTPEGQRQEADWHLTKLRIDRAADVDPLGNALNARDFGATWEQIGGAYGITAADAADRWDRTASAYIESYSGTSTSPRRETNTTATEPEQAEDRPRRRIERSR